MVPFKIIHLDGLGQGVSRPLSEGGKVTFIEKVLPGEEGKALVVHEKSKVQFAQLESTKDLTHYSPIRIHPECAHFEQCPGCHFLHTSYENELHFKQLSLRFELKKIIKLVSAIQSEDEFPINVFASSKRFQYRNRIVLHYDLDQRILGIKRSNSNDILPIPNCRLPQELIQKHLSDLYANDNWIKLIQNNRDHRPQGHIELYLRELEGKETLVTSINRPYADGGFSQVNREINLKLKEFVKQEILAEIGTTKDLQLFDFFGGGGNLSQNLWNNFARITIIDSYTQAPSPTENHITFNAINLFNMDSLKNWLRNQVSDPKSIFIIDPPRSGWTHAELVATKINPRLMAFVSCSPNTLARDLDKLSQHYHLKSISLFDMFPGTHHFETVAMLQRKA